jgi:5-methyltetrahydrofolate--homocysteine methyltransferase
MEVGLVDDSKFLMDLAEAVTNGEDEQVRDLTNGAIAAGIQPLKIINEGLTKGIEMVGKRFAAGEYFLPDLLLGAKAMEAGINILEPMLAGTNRQFLGKVLMGTVKGDLHCIGKNIVIIMLKSSGFDVIDLGVDVPSSKFIEKIKEHKPDIVGISALLTTTVGEQKNIIESLKEEGLRDQVKIMIGGAPISQSWADQIGADGYAEDASVAVLVAKKLLAK